MKSKPASPICLGQDNLHGVTSALILTRSSLDTLPTRMERKELLKEPTLTTEPQEGRSGKLQDFIIQVRTANHGLHLKLGVLKSIPKTNPQIPHWIDRLDRMIYEGPWSLHGTLMQVLSMKICWDAACHPGFLFSRKMPTSPHPIWLWLNIIDPRKKSESNSWACFGPGFPPLNHKSRSLVWSQWKSPSSDG